jgi:DHA2 family multidrug resistance protein
MSLSASPDSAKPVVLLWAGYAAMCIGMFMAILDIQIVITSLPVIQEALGIGADRMSWVQTAYLIAEVIAIPLTGLLTRVFSMRRLFVGAIAIFTFASVGCAFSGEFASLVVWRILQGFAGGVLIPLVFSAIFLLFERGFQQTLATTMGGVLAVMAPVLGPITGGWITENYSWQWLFLINVVPGAVTLLLGFVCLPRGASRLSLFKHLDWMSVALVAAALAALEIGLKEAPDRGWTSVVVLGLFAIVAVAGYLAVRRPAPAIDFALLGDRNLAYGCVLSFILGAGLFGSVYLMPVFLAFVRGHGPIDIGLVILVTGIAQLVTAPIAVQLDRRCSARLLSVVGFACFALGLALSGFQSRATDYDEMFWPQVVRGGFVALCILPPIRFALGYLPLDRVSDASGLFNLSRNLGGAIGIALIDTILFTRGPEHAGRLTEMIKSDPAGAATALGIGVDELPDPNDPTGLMAIMDAVQEASLTLAINEAWLMLAAMTSLALVLLWAIGPIRGSPPPLLGVRRVP